jgi:hypothetical protein
MAQHVRQWSLDYRSMTIAEEASLAGALYINQTPPFKASPGQTLAMLASASLTGTLATEPRLPYVMPSNS